MYIIFYIAFISFILQFTPGTSVTVVDIMQVIAYDFQRIQLSWNAEREEDHNMNCYIERKIHITLAQCGTG